MRKYGKRGRNSYPHTDFSMAQGSGYQYNKTHTMLQATLQKNSLNNKNGLILTPKFVLSIVHSGNLSSKLLQRQVKYFNQFKQGRAIFSYESLY